MIGIFNHAYATYYNLLYRDKDYAAEAASIRGCLNQHGIEGGVVLDLGCGTGNHARELALLGYNVLGIEKSERMLGQANSSQPKDGKGKAKFEIGDVRSYRNPGRFDAVVSLFHVINYQTSNDDLIATFDTAAYHLRCGGLFIFDSWYGPAVLGELPSTRIKRVTHEEITILRLAEPSLDVRKNLVEVRYTIFVQQSGRELQEWQEIHRIRYLFEPELNDLLQRAGFELCDCHETGTGRALGANTWSATFVAKRR